MEDYGLMNTGSGALKHFSSIFYVIIYFYLFHLSYLFLYFIQIK